MTNLVTLVHPKSGGRAEVAAIRVPQLKRQGWRVEAKEKKAVEASKTSTETTEATGAEASKKEKE